MTMQDDLRQLRNQLALEGDAWTANRIDAILARYADHVVVPVEPTEAILMPGWRDSNVYSPTAYRAMITAGAKNE